MPSVIDENTQFIDELTNTPISNGYIYIGSQNLDAKLNPITIYPDRGLSGTPLANPQRTGADGRALNKIWVPGKYSMKVEDSANVQKLNDLDLGQDEQVGNTLLIDSLGINDVTVTGSPTQTAYVDNQTYIFTAPANNTGAMTLKIDSLAVKDIKKAHDQAMASGDVKAGQKLVVVYNSTDDWFELQSGVPGSVFGSDIVLTEQSDHSSTPAAGSGYLWVKNDAPNRLTFTDDTGVDHPLGASGVVSGHIKAGSKQIIDGSTTPDVTTQAIAALTVAGTFETFGPTGSGATNIWTDMDQLPANATILLVDVLLTVTASSVLGGSASFYATEGSDSNSISSTRNRLAYLYHGTNDTTNAVASTTTPVEIPLNSSLVFRSTWGELFSSPTTVTIVYRGFITD